MYRNKLRKHGLVNAKSFLWSLKRLSGDVTPIIMNYCDDHFIDPEMMAPHLSTSPSDMISKFSESRLRDAFRYDEGGH